MKKISILLSFIIGISCSFAQVQRAKSATKQSSDSLSAITGTKQTGKVGKKQIMKDLNISREQKSKLKELQLANKAKMDEIKNNDKLTPEEREAKLKAVRQEQLKSTGAVLNDEQKAKMKQLMKEKQKNKKKNADMDQQ